MPNYVDNLDVIDPKGSVVNALLQDRETLALATSNTVSIDNLANEVELMKFKRLFYVREYGAVGDGIADDTTAIQNAINECAGNGIIVFDPLTYKITNTITISNSFVALVGYLDKQRQFGATIIADFLDRPVVSFTNTSLLEGCGIYNLSITRSSIGEQGSKTISVENCLYTTFENCGFSKSQYGLYCRNINGVFVNHCHGTTAGDLGSNVNVYGIYIDGANNANNSGLILKGYIYYGYDTPNSISHGITCTATAQGGDIRIYDVECSGDVNYGISIEAGDGFANDIIIDGLSMDSVQSAGIEISGNLNHDWQNCNISNVWLRLNGVGAHGISANFFEHVFATNISINGEHVTDAYDVTGIYFANCNNFSLTNISMSGYATKLCEIVNCLWGQVTGLLSRISDSHVWVTNSTGILFENCNIAGTIFCGYPNTNCLKNNCIDNSSNTAIKLNITDMVVNSSKGGTHQFTAKINGIVADNSQVVWAIAGSRGANTSINNGLLTIDANETEKTMFVLCKSAANNDIHDIAVVNIY